MDILRRHYWLAILVPCAMVVYVAVAYALYLSYRPEVFPFSAWGMFAVQSRHVTEYGVRVLSPAGCAAAGDADPGSAESSFDPATESLLPLDARGRQLAAAAYRLESRGNPGGEHFRALLEDGVVAEGACYELVALRLDSWSEPPGAPELRGRVGPYASDRDHGATSYRPKGRGKLGERKQKWIVKRRKRP